MRTITRISRMLLLLATCNQLVAVDYGELMTAKIRNVLGKKGVKGYTFATYPLDNYGLATAYEGKVNPEREICATWDCLGIRTDEEISNLSAEHKLRLLVKGVQFAEVGSGTDKNIVLTEDEKKAIGLNAILPKILSALNITGDYSRTNEINTVLTLGPITVRTLRRKEMIDTLNGPNAHSLEKAVWKDGKGDLVLVYSDIVLTSMKIELKVNPETKLDIGAKLEGALQGKVGKTIGSGSSLSLKVDNSTKGNYVFETTRPLILAVYTKKQPRSGMLGAGRGWNDWKDFDLGRSNRVVAEKVDLGEKH